jgi:hypothetical protein
MGEIETVLDGGETVLWQGRPALLPFFAAAILSFLLGTGILVVSARLVAGQPAWHPTGLAAALLLLAPLLLVGLLLAVAYPIWRLLAFLRISYVITTQRVVLQRGVIEHEFAMLDLDQVVQALVEVDFTDILLGFGQTGSISVVTRAAANAAECDAEGPPHVFAHILHPDEVFRFFHRTEYDAKTDIEFPNRFRPDVNPGYPTTFPPKTTVRTLE